MSEPIKIGLADRLAAIELSRAMLDDDGELWDATVREVIGRYAGLDGVLRAFAVEHLTALSDCCGGDQVAVRRSLLEDREDATRVLPGGVYRSAPRQIMAVG